MSLPSDHDRRLQSARVALEGLSIGDAFGQQFFAGLPQEIATRKPALGPWRYTDDTEMALAIFEVLRDCGTIDQDLLAKSFARRYQLESDRGYGAGARMVLQDIADGIPWYESARQLFGGQGSLGNGAAMRVAPIGAYFADDLGQVVEQASASAEITHLHPEARAGAIAVALAEAGVDLFWIETMASLEEMHAAMLGVQQAVPGRPMITTMTFDTRGFTMMGVSPEKAVEAVLGWGADAAGGNCGNGPDEVLEVLRKMRAVAPQALLVAKANAGIPELVGGRAVYRAGPQVMAEHAVAAARAGARIIGACCGSTPAHLHAMAEALSAAGLRG